MGPTPHLLNVVPYPELPASQDKGATRNQQGWWTTPDRKIRLSRALERTLLHQLNQTTHLGQTKMLQVLDPHFHLLEGRKTAEEIASQCPACAQVNPKKGKIKEPRHRERGTYPGDHWEVDFTEVTPTVGG